MKVYIASLESISAYSQSRYHGAPAKDREPKDKYEERTWRQKMHTTKRGTVFIPPMSIKKAMEAAAKYRSETIPGKGKATYTKHFKAGVMVTEPIDIGIKADDVPGEWLLMNADGKPGTGTRVRRCFPLIEQWCANVKIYVLDDQVIDDAVLRRHLDVAGSLIGIGRFRPEVGGFNGRFRVVSIEEGK